MTSSPQPPFSPEATEILAALNEFFPVHILPEMIEPMRLPVPGVPTNLELALAAYPDVRHSERTAAGYDGAEITLAVFEPADGVKNGSGVYFMHGGGMILGDQYNGATELAKWVTELNTVVVSVDYRLSPEHPYPVPTEDSYAGLVWFAENAASLGVDASRIVIAGSSAGGNLAAAVALLARDRKGPAIAGQLLQYPMLDDRDDTVSAKVYREVGLWSGVSNDTGWGAFLGERRGTPDVPIYAAPARAIDLSGLPPAFIDVGGAELFRDEDIAYATKLLADGVPVELHVWPGIWHAFEAFAPDHSYSAEILERRVAWLRKALG